ncbi:hypothetical protein BDW22DRAFT_702260 [Trametopsis cervina]|nr:hypothetical protein BDW22DRAFT_702260 [Trametopsis cervina]
MADQLALGPSSEPLGAASNPMHVVSRPEPIKGWPGLQSDVEGFDKQEIEGHKDDIDTLLVFTGLFSAVLAAFVLIAYTLLEPDAAGATLSVVTQMSTQGASYHVEGDFINSTTPATPPPPFEPTYNAIVVNDLWTASLIISLATASFAILVKQWLRQYIKYTTSFPQGRMRVRHFRREGLERWYVLEIAAFLPFLLQVSLALFFVGLCYFTADVHPSVRNTTLPLVCGWAFLFIAATIFPIFSAQCPYKTPALDGLTTFLRDLLWSMWTGIMKHLAAVQWQPSPTILLRLVGIVRRWADRQHMRLTNMTFSRNEDAASKSDSADFAILLNADKLHGNDEVVDTAISHAIQQSKIKWEDAIELVQQLILNRLPSQDMFSGHPKIVELGDLTPRALMAVHNILDYTESFHAATLEYPWGPVPFLESVSAGKKPECWVFFLRLSVSLVQPPTTLPRWLDRSNWDDCRTLGEICQPSKSAQVLQSLLALLCRRLERPDFNLSTPLPRLQAFLEVYFDELHVPDSFGAEQPRPWSDVLNAESLGPTIAWLTQQLKSDIATPPAGPSDKTPASSMISHLWQSNQARYWESFGSRASTTDFTCQGTLCL